MAEFRLETPRLILRDWREEDFAVYYHHTNTEAVMRHLGGVMDAQAMAEGRDRMLSYSAQYGHTFWAVERKQDGGPLAGELLGFCGLKRANQVGAPIGDFEIGWRLREDSWGHGYAGEAAKAAMASGFETFGAPHIIALTIDSNVASWRLMERLGMERRRDLDFTNPAFDPEGGPIIVYSITRDQWQKQQ